MSYEFCKELLEGFVEAIPEEKVEELYQEHLQHPTTRPNTTITVYKNRYLRGTIVNKLLSGEYKDMFLDLSVEETAALLNTSTKRLNENYDFVLKKLVALRLNREYRQELQEMKLTIEEKDSVNYQQTSIESSSRD